MCKLWILWISVFVVGCSATSLPSSSDAEVRASQRSAQGGYRVLYAFRGSRDGALPMAGLLPIGGGTMIGTTFAGGSNLCGGSGCGTLFTVNEAGSETVLHAFQKDHKLGRDGAGPEGEFSGYGTTIAGGLGCSDASHGGGCGVIFTVTRDGNERVVYRFKGTPEGQAPIGSLAAPLGSNAALFGVTELGGAYNKGTLYSWIPSKKPRTLHSFYGAPDGAFPLAGLSLVGNNAFYGTTSSGGNACSSYGGCGTVFSVDTDGDFATLYSFKGGSDGAAPAAAMDGAVGVTISGGKNCPSAIDGGGCGTIFKIEGSKRESVLYRFRGYPSDGAQPISIQRINGVFYGVTQTGGAHNFGTIFTFAKNKEHVIYSFKGGTNGAFPIGFLAQLYDGSPLYGVTESGGTGCGSLGCGVIYSLK